MVQSGNNETWFPKRQSLVNLARHRNAAFTPNGNYLELSEGYDKKKTQNSQLLRRLNRVFKDIVSGADVLIKIYFMTVFTVSDGGIDRFPTAQMHHRFAIHAFSPVCGGTCWLLNLASSLTYQFRSNKKMNARENDFYFVSLSMCRRVLRKRWRPSTWF